MCVKCLINGSYGEDDVDTELSCGHETPQSVSSPMLLTS